MWYGENRDGCSMERTEGWLRTRNSHRAHFTIHTLHQFALALRTHTNAPSPIRRHRIALSILFTREFALLLLKPTAVSSAKYLLDNGVSAKDLGRLTCAEFERLGSIDLHMRKTPHHIKINRKRKPKSAKRSTHTRDSNAYSNRNSLTKRYAHSDDFGNRRTKHTHSLSGKRRRIPSASPGCLITIALSFTVELSSRNVQTLITLTISKMTILPHESHPSIQKCFLDSSCHND